MMSKKERNSFYWVTIILLTLVSIVGFIIDSTIPLIFFGFFSILYYLVENST